MNNTNTVLRGTIEDIFECKGIKCYILKDNENKQRIGYLEIEPNSRLFNVEMEDIADRINNINNIVALYDEFQSDIVDIVYQKESKVNSSRAIDKENAYREYISYRVEDTIDSLDYYEQDDYKPECYSDLVNSNLEGFELPQTTMDEICRFIGFRTVPITNLINTNAQKHIEHTNIKNIINQIMSNLGEYL